MLEPNASQRPRNLKPNRARGAILRQIVDIIDANLYGYDNVAKEAGTGTATVTAMRRGRAPSICIVERIARVLGYRLALEPVNSAQRATAWALRVRGEIIDVTLDHKKIEQWMAKGWTVIPLVEEEIDNAGT